MKFVQDIFGIVEGKNGDWKTHLDVAVQNNHNHELGIELLQLINFTRRRTESQIHGRKELLIDQPQTNLIRNVRNRIG